MLRLAAARRFRISAGSRDEKADAQCANVLRLARPQRLAGSTNERPLWGEKRTSLGLGALSV